MDRLQKILSAAGVCSRRQAEAYLTAGRVAVNGRILLLLIVDHHPLTLRIHLFRAISPFVKRTTPIPIEST